MQDARKPNLVRYTSEQMREEMLSRGQEPPTKDAKLTRLFPHLQGYVNRYFGDLDEKPVKFVVNCMPVHEAVWDMSVYEGGSYEDVLIEALDALRRKRRST